MINYTSFYRNFGVLRVDGMKKFPIRNLSSFELPLGASIHNYTVDQSAVGMNQDDPMLRGMSQNAAATFIRDYAHEFYPLGSPILVKVNIEQDIQKYFSNNQRINKLQADPKAIERPTTPIIYNYNMMEATRKYPVQRYDTHIARWMNRWNCLIEELKATTIPYGRNHFIRMDVPANLPAPSVLKTLHDNVIRFKETWKPEHFKRDLLEDFRSDALLSIFDFWMWLGPYPEYSHLGKLRFEHLDRINVVFTMGGNFTVINLGRLHQWVRRKVVPPGYDKRMMMLDPLEMQKRFLHYLLTLSRTLTMSAEEILDMNSEGVEGEENDHVVDANLKLDTSNMAKKHVNIQVTEDKTDVSRGDDVVVDTKYLKVRHVPDKQRVQEAFTTTQDREKGIEYVAEVDKVVEADLQQLEFLAAERKVDEISGDSYKVYEPVEMKPETAIETKANLLARRGVLSAAEIRRASTLANKYRELKSPFDSNKTIAEDMRIDPNTLKIGERTPLASEIKGVLDPSMLSSSLKVFDNKYLKEVLSKDYLNVVMSLQNAEIAVQSYEVNHLEDMVDDCIEHVIKVVPLTGRPSTIRFTTPNVDEHGNFKAGGTTYRMRKQYSDLPIRKVAPDRVALTSYYSKMFVTRSERAVFNYEKWITKHLAVIGTSGDDDRVLDLRMGNVFTPEVVLPRTYSAIAKSIAGFRSGDVNFNFEYVANKKLYGEEAVNATPEGLVICGKSDDGQLLYMNQAGDISRNGAVVGTIESLLKLDQTKRPVEMAEISIFRQAIPMGFVLAYYLGLGNLLKTVGCEHRRVKRGNPYDIQSHEFAVKFEDETLIFSRRDDMARLLFNGFNRYRNDVSKHSIYLFDRKDIYGTILTQNGLGLSYMTECDFMQKMWVDHFTRDELIAMNEPTDFVLLLLSAVKKLANDAHKDPMDTRELRIKGYERLAGLAYSEMVRSARVYASRRGSPYASCELNPYEVWNKILKDETVIGIEESNPIHSLKEQEVVVFRGSGGRSAQSMNAAARIYHRNAMGVVSEANTDNGDVATINYLTADPNLTTVRGLTRDLDSLEGNAAKIVSTTMLVAPGADRDD